MAQLIWLLMNWSLNTSTKSYCKLKINQFEKMSKSWFWCKETSKLNKLTYSLKMSQAKRSTKANLKLKSFFFLHIPLDLEVSSFQKVSILNERKITEFDNEERIKKSWKLKKLHWTSTIISDKFVFVKVTAFRTIFKRDNLLRSLRSSLVNFVCS